MPNVVCPTRNNRYMTIGELEERVTLLWGIHGAPEGQSRLGPARDSSALCPHPIDRNVPTTY